MWDCDCVCVWGGAPVAEVVRGLEQALKQAQARAAKKPQQAKELAQQLQSARQELARGGRDLESASLHVGYVRHNVRHATCPSRVGACLASCRLARVLPCA